MNEEYQALETLVNSEGWRRLVAYAVTEFGDTRTLQKLESDLAAVGKADEAGQRTTVMRHLDARSAAFAILSWPSAVMKQHKAAQEAAAAAEQPKRRQRRA